ncbi:MAG: aldo/keto reductase [Parvularculaceae bacterium]
MKGDFHKAELGFGVSGPLGAKWFSAAKARGLIEQALSSGVRHFDTAHFYGEAEARLGEATEGAPDIFISTKTGTRRNGAEISKDFTEAGMRSDVEGSLKRLQRSSLDMLYLHGPSKCEIDAALPILRAMKSEGLIDAFGVCGEGAPLVYAAEKGVYAIMGAFNVFDRRHQQIFHRAKSAGVMTVAIEPLAVAATAPIRFPSSLSDLRRMARSIRQGRTAPPAEAYRDIVASFGGWRPPEAALAFVCAEPSIDVVLTTTTKTRHLAQSVAAANRELPDALNVALQNLSLDRDPDGA